MRQTQVARTVEASVCYPALEDFCKINQRKLEEQREKIDDV